MARGQDNGAVAVAVAGAAHVMQAAAEAVKMGIARMILVGDAGRMREIARTEGFDLDLFEIVDEKDCFAACKVAVGLVSGGRATALMKGDVDTAMVMRAALCRETGMRSGRKLSHIAAFETPN